MAKPTGSHLLTLAALAALFALLPSALAKPGLPVVLQFQEAEYFLQSASLAFDRDLECERADLDRLFFEYAFAGEQRLGLRSTGSLRFGQPLLYPLIGAPFVAALGSNGLRVLNALLLFGSIALLARWLTSRIGALASLLAPLFLLLGPAIAYIFWLRPTLLCLFLVTAALTLAWPSALPAPRWRLVAAGLALGLAILHFPWLLLLALPIAVALVEPGKRDWLPWSIGLVIGLVLLGAVQQVTLGAVASPDLQAFSFNKPGDPPRALPVEIEGSTIELPSALWLALIERRTGFLVYFPLALLALLAAWPWRSLADRVLASTLAVLVLAQPWLGEGRPELLTNPAALSFYPGFLMLVRRLKPAPLFAGTALATLLLGPILTSSLGSPVPGAGLHAHTRVFPFPHLPLDPGQVTKDSGGFRSLNLGGQRLWAPADQAEIHGEELWLAGGESVELFLESPTPIEQGVFQLRALKMPARLRFATDDVDEGLDLRAEDGGIAQRQVRVGAGRKGPRGAWIYRLRVSSETGTKLIWLDKNAEEDFFVGAIVTYLGTPEFLAQDLYHAGWLSCAVPGPVKAGQLIAVEVAVKNTSSATWPQLGAARVRLTSRWLDQNGNKIADNPPKALDRDAPSGDLIKASLRAKTPAIPGRYLLETDLIFESVAFFSHRGAATCRVEVVIE